MQLNQALNLRSGTRTFLTGPDGLHCSKKFNEYKSTPPRFKQKKGLNPKAKSLKCKWAVYVVKVNDTHQLAVKLTGIAYLLDPDCEKFDREVAVRGVALLIAKLANSVSELGANPEYVKRLINELESEVTP